MATTSTTPKVTAKVKSENVALSLNFKSPELQPFKAAWITYANQPTNSGKSYSELLRTIVAEAIGFDLSTIKIKTRGKADTDAKLMTKLMKKVKETHDKVTAIEAMAMSLLASGVDISDMFEPEQIARLKQMMKAEGNTSPSMEVGLNHLEKAAAK